jgi:hypothetical protein
MPIFMSSGKEWNGMQMECKWNGMEWMSNGRMDWSSPLRLHLGPVTATLFHYATPAAGVRAGHVKAAPVQLLSRVFKILLPSFGGHLHL